MRRAALLAGVTVMLLLVWTGWRAAQGLIALKHADATLSASRDLLMSDHLLITSKQAGKELHEARASFQTPLLRLAAHVPKLGASVAEIQILTTAADRTLNEVLLPLALSLSNDPARHLTRGSRIDVAYLSALAAPVAEADKRMTSVAKVATEAPQSGLKALSSRRDAFQAQIAKLQTGLRALKLATTLGPTLLGATAPQNYLLIPQNPSEARGSGGLVGGYVTLQASAGSIRQTSSGPSTLLEAFDHQVSPVVDLGQEFTRNYVNTKATRSSMGDRDPRTSWFTSNNSPHFPDTAQVWRGLWQQQTGQQVDGVLALDPVAISYLLQATGSINLADGTSVTSQNAVKLMMVDAYQDYGSRRVQRKAYLQEISNAVAVALTQPGTDPRLLLSGVTRAVDEHRLQFWSAHNFVQAQLQSTNLGGELPGGQRGVGDVVGSAVGTKLDYYMERSLIFASSCAPTDPSRLTLTLRNAAPLTGLPDYVAVPFYSGALPPGSPRGTNKSLVTIYFPASAVQPKLTLNGQPIDALYGNERNLRRVQLLIRLEPSQQQQLQLSFFETNTKHAEVVRIRQALVFEEKFANIQCPSSPAAVGN